jgi:hypothetical protein
VGLARKGGSCQHDDVEATEVDHRSGDDPCLPPLEAIQRRDTWCAANINLEWGKANSPIMREDVVRRRTSEECQNEGDHRDVTPQQENLCWRIADVNMRGLDH